MNIFSSPQTLRKVLLLAAAYNILWGAHAVLFPELFWSLIELPAPNYLFLWQCIGMIVGVYGVGYAIAAQDPFKHWPIVLVGMLGKIFGPIGFLWTWAHGELPLKFGVVILANDLIWLPFFLAILVQVYHQYRFDTEAPPAIPLRDALAQPLLPEGGSLSALSQGRTVLLIFLRHTGCTFCRETMSNLQTQQERLRTEGVIPVIVHQSSAAQFAEFAAQYDLATTPAISDPERALYRSFALGRGSLTQLFGLQVIAAALRSWRHGVGLLEGDGFQMPGAFLIRDGVVQKEFKYPHAGATLDLCAFGKLEPSNGGSR